MAVINRSDLPADLPQDIPTELVPFAPLGGEVMVRGLTMGEQFANAALSAAQRVPREGESEATAVARANGDVALQVATVAVVDPADGRALLTPGQWRALAAKHGSAVYAVAGVALRLSGGDVEAVEKN